VFVQDDDLVTLRPDGTHRTRLTRYGPSRHAIQPSFTPDGTRIVFSYVKTQVGVNDSPTASLIGLDGSGFTTLVDGATHPRIRP
jgi:Tol biopolymer transport system component